MAREYFEVMGRSFENRAEYNKALRDQQLIEKLKKNVDLKNRTALERLLKEIKGEKIRFYTIPVSYTHLVMGKKKYLIATLWVFLSAAVDEWHQSFVPGRYASIKDVLLDTCGGICGIVLLTLIIKGRKKSRENQPRRYR